MKAPNNLFVMTRFNLASQTNRASRRRNQASEPCPDGWIANTFWVSKDTAGLNGGARRREVMAKYREYFQTISNKDYNELYPTSKFMIQADIEYNRIKPEYRKEWNAICELAVSEWKKKHGELRW